jgi:uncharacterized protein YjdB/pectate lyase
MRKALSLIVSLMLMSVVSFAGCSKKHSSDSSAVTGITLKSSTTICAGGTEQLTAISLPSNTANQDINWTSSDKSIVFVSNSGIVTGITTGSATITATSVFNAGKSATCVVTVAATAVDATDITLDKLILPLAVAASGTLSATIAPTGATNQNVTWSTSDSTVASISGTTGSGVSVTGIAEGSATITATCVSNSAVMASCTVKVGATVDVTGISLNKASDSISKGSTETLIATVIPATATNKNVTWSTSNPSVATVTSAGLVTGVANGNATITVLTIDGGFMATCIVTVSSSAAGAPTITSFSPASGAIGTTVNIIGTNFAGSASGNTVKFNGVAATVSSATSTLITVSVPAGTTTGTISVTTSGGSATSGSSFTVSTTTASSIYNLTGFASTVTGGGTLAETDPAYAKVSTPQQFLDALYSWYKGKAYGSYTTAVKVIEITADLNLGYLEVGTAVTSSTSGSSIMDNHAAAKLHPVLITTGVSKININQKNGGLTIFSRNGASIKHTCFNIKGTTNIIIRNLKFDELWEWDEGTKGNYDTNDWDFIDIGNGSDASNVWIDHCTFTKAYDGIIDIKGASSNITISWCKYTGDDGATNSNSFVRQQFTKFESSLSSYPMYNFLRTNGFSYEDMVQIAQGHDKTHLIGATTSSANAAFTITLHHDLFMNPWDRLPRLRGGQVHVFNIYVDDTLGLIAKRRRDAIVSTMTSANQIKMNGSGSTDATYKFNPFLNGTISTESGAILVEKSVYVDCLTPLRNNQTDPSNATYTGKVLALDSIYHFDNADGSTVDLRGNSNDTSVFTSKNTNGTGYMGPAQAAVIDFSWNTAAWNTSGLPYNYVMDDPTNLKSVLNSGAGAGVISWDYSNWLKTTY